MECIADTTPQYLMHPIYACVLEQHFTRCALSGKPICDTIWGTMEILVQDVSHSSPFNYRLPESLATACGINHDLRYLKQFDLNDMFLSESALRHIIDFRADSYSDGSHEYDDDCRFLKPFKCPAEIYARFSYCIRPGHEWLIDGGDAMVHSKWGSYRYFLLFMCQNELHRHLLPQGQKHTFLCGCTKIHRRTCAC